MEALQVKSCQVVLQSWLDEHCFEIVAKMPEGLTSESDPGDASGVAGGKVQARRPQR
jgi:uncharacterized protein (TIGR03435 family)